METTVAIHQPNYLPWLGYFHKIAAADAFIFLDDAQYSKNSYINRVKILGPNGPGWLTIPVSYSFGDGIHTVRPAVSDWPNSHLDSLRNLYSHTPAFRAVWPKLKDLLLGVPQANLAAINRYLVENLCREMNLRCRFLASSDMDVGGKRRDDRLVSLVATIHPTATYLSGKGAADYQDPEKYRKAGLGFRYVNFLHPRYDQGRATFEAGLSIVDPLLRIGLSATAELISKSVVAA